MWLACFYARIAFDSEVITFESAPLGLRREHINEAAFMLGVRRTTVQGPCWFLKRPTELRSRRSLSLNVGFEWEHGVFLLTQQREKSDGFYRVAA